MEVVDDYTIIMNTYIDTCQDDVYESRKG